MTTILIVDDEEMNLILVQEILNANGYETLVASDGKAGCEAALERHPDLILMDVRMPVLDGIAALARLRSHADTRAIPVIALTAYAMKEDQERIRASGFDACLFKPIKIDELLALIAGTLKK